MITEKDVFGAMLERAEEKVNPTKEFLETAAKLKIQFPECDVKRLETFFKESNEQEFYFNEYGELEKNL